MRQTFLSFIFVLFCFSGNAQEDFSFGLRSSLDFNSYSTVEEFGILSYKGKVGFSIGPAFKSALSENLFLSYGILYSMKNYKIELGNYNPIVNGDPVIVGDDEWLISNSFIELPIDLGFNIKRYKQTEIYGTAGIVNSFQVGYNNDGHQDSKTYNDYLLSLKLGAGLTIKTEKFGFSVEPQMRFYLTDVHRGDYYPTDEKPFQFGLQLQVLKL